MTQTGSLQRLKREGWSSACLWDTPLKQDVRPVGTFILFSLPLLNPSCKFFVEATKLLCCFLRQGAWHPTILLLTCIPGGEGTGNYSLSCLMLQVSGLELRSNKHPVA